MNKKPGKNKARDLGFYALILVILLAVIFTMNRDGKVENVTYSELRELFLNEHVESFEAEGNTIVAKLKDESFVTCDISTISIFYNELGELIIEQKEAGIISEYDYPPEPQPSWFVSFLPYLMLCRI